MIDVERTIMSQYANSPTICGLIQGINECVDPRSDIQAFLDYVWNINTARGFGLDIWGKIIGVNSRQVQVSSEIQYFGFDTGAADTYPFGEGIFYTDAEEMDLYRLSDTAFRTVLMAKAMANISRCTPFAINRILRNLFTGRGDCHVADLGNMQMRYVFNFYLLPWEEAIIDQMNVLPKPAGVELLGKIVAVEPFFGFLEMGGLASPFDQAPFYAEV